MKIKSIQYLELSSICVGSFVIRESPNCVVRKSSSEPSKLVISIEHESLDLALKSPIKTVRNGLPHDNLSKSGFKFDLNI